MKRRPFSRIFQFRFRSRSHGDETRRDFDWGLHGSLIFAFCRFFAEWRDENENENDQVSSIHGFAVSIPMDINDHYQVIFL